MKQCSICGETKPLGEFQKRAQSKDGYAGWCKPCKREYDNAYYEANPDRRSYIRESNNKRVLQVRAWIKNYLEEHPCVDCGESDIVVLEFDHRGEKTENVAVLLKTSNLNTVIDEVSKCDVRCANCHRRKTARTLGSWRIASLV